MLGDSTIVNCVQSTGIIVLSFAVIYVAWRLEKVMVAGIAAIRTVTKTHQDLLKSQDALEVSIEDAWRRIEKIEVHQKS